MSEPPCKLSLQFGGFSPNKMYVTIHAPMPKIEKKAAKSDILKFSSLSLFFTDLWLQSSIAELDHNFKSPDLMTIIQPPNLNQPQSFVTPKVPAMVR